MRAEVAFIFSRIYDDAQRPTHFMPHWCQETYVSEIKTTSK